MTETLNIKLYTAKEVAEMLEVSEMTIKRYIKSGKIKAKKIGGKWKITEEALKEYLNN